MRLSTTDISLWSCFLWLETEPLDPAAKEVIGGGEVSTLSFRRRRPSRLRVQRNHSRSFPSFFFCFPRLSFVFFHRERFNSDTGLLSTNQKSKTFKTGREREKDRERDSSSPFQVLFSVPALLLCNDDVFPLPVLVRRARRALLRRARVHAPELGRRLLQR